MRRVLAAAGWCVHLFVLPAQVFSGIRKHSEHYQALLEVVADAEWEEKLAIWAPLMPKLAPELPAYFALLRKKAKGANLTWIEEHQLKRYNKLTTDALLAHCQKVIATQ